MLPGKLPVGDLEEFGVQGGLPREVAEAEDASRRGWMGLLRGF
jgi:hypothetical protein